MPDMPYYRCPVEGCDYTDEGGTVGGDEGFNARMDEHIEKHKHDLVLITNIEFVSVHGVRDVRCDAHAVLIQPPREPLIGEPRATVRGFGVDPAQPVFTVWLDTEDASFEIVDAADPSKILMGDSGAARPIFSGALLRIGGVEMFLQIGDHQQAISVERFSQDEFDPVWRALPGRVAKFWPAPDMPTLRWVDADSVRREHQSRYG